MTSPGACSGRRLVHLREVVGVARDVEDVGRQAEHEAVEAVFLHHPVGALEVDRRTAAQQRRAPRDDRVEGSCFGAGRGPLTLDCCGAGGGCGARGGERTRDGAGQRVASRDHALPPAVRS
jgi:hypothetical protein